MRSVNIAELKNQLSKYVTFAKDGEEIIIRDRNLPVAKLVPFTAENVTDEEALLVAAGIMRVPETPLDVDAFLKLPMVKMPSGEGTKALLADRDESL